MLNASIKDLVTTVEYKEFCNLTVDYASAITNKDKKYVQSLIEEKTLKLSKRLNLKLNVVLKSFTTMHKLRDILNKILGRDNLVVGELGAHKGGSTKVIAEWLGSKGHLTVVEWFQGSPRGIPDEWAVAPDDKGEIKAEFLETMKPYEDIYTLMEMSSEEASWEIESETFDWFWIDADHRYENVKRDIELWYPKVKVGGILAGHDYEGHTYDERYVNIDCKAVKGMTAVHHGVVKAVTERFGEPNHFDNYWWVRKE